MLNYKLMEFFDGEPEIVPDIAIKEEPAPYYIGHRKRVKEGTVKLREIVSKNCDVAIVFRTVNTRRY